MCGGGSYQPLVGTMQRFRPAKADFSKTVSDRAFMIVSMTGRPRALVRPTGMIPHLINDHPRSLRTGISWPGFTFTFEEKLSEQGTPVSAPSSEAVWVRKSRPGNVLKDTVANDHHNQCDDPITGINIARIVRLSAEHRTRHSHNRKCNCAKDNGQQQIAGCGHGHEPAHQ